MCALAPSEEAAAGRKKSVMLAAACLTLHSLSRHSRKKLSVGSRPRRTMMSLDRSCAWSILQVRHNTMMHFPRNGAWCCRAPHLERCLSEVKKQPLACVRPSLALALCATSGTCFQGKQTQNVSDQDLINRCGVQDCKQLQAFQTQRFR